MENKASNGELKGEINLFNNKLDDLQKEIAKKLSLCPSQKDIDKIFISLEEKANMKDVSELLEQKANKSNVANALHR